MSEHVSESRLAMSLLGITLALGFVLSSDAITKAMVRMRQENVIRVKGTAQERIRSNRGNWKGEICSHAKTLAEAYDLIELIKQGIEFRSFQPNYLYTDLDTLKKDMLAKATVDYALSRTEESERLRILFEKPLPDAAYTTALAPSCDVMAAFGEPKVKAHRLGAERLVGRRAPHGRRYVMKRELAQQKEHLHILPQPLRRPLLQFPPPPLDIAPNPRDAAHVAVVFP